MTLLKLIPIIIALLFTANTNASTWAFSNVTFDDDTYLTGSFQYENGVFNNINITTSPGGRTNQLGNTWDGFSSVPDSFYDMGVSYYEDEGIVGTNTFGEPITMEWGHSVSFNFEDSLDSGLTSINILFGLEYYYEYYTNTYPYDPLFEDWRYVTSGQIVMATPIPAAVWLFASGLIGLTGFARYRKS